MTPTYDPGTIQKLVSCHGPERAALIVAGKDPATNCDLAAWDRLGRLSETPFARDRRARADRNEKIVRLYRSGVHPALIGERVGLCEREVAAILKPVFGNLGWGQSR